MVFPESWSGSELVDDGKVMTIVMPDSLTGRTSHEQTRQIPLIMILIMNKSDLATNGYGYFDSRGFYCRNPVPEPTSLNNMSTIRFDTECQNQMLNMKITGFTFEKEDKIIFITYGASSQSVFDGHLDDFSAATKTLKIEGTKPILETSSFSI